MNIGIVTRPTVTTKWGGDLRALYAIGDGLEELGHKVYYGPTANEVLKSEYIFLSNTCSDNRKNAEILQKKNKSYGVIGFHEDFIKYFGMAMAVPTYVDGMLKKMKDGGIPYSIEAWCSSPEVLRYYAQKPAKNGFINQNVLADAQACIANSPMERDTMLRDSPTCNANSVFWELGLGGDNPEYSDEFLKVTGLKKGEYILQVGRLETRKNQISSVLATRNLDMPLVFIATTGYQENWYDPMVLECAKRYRKGDTIILHEAYEDADYGNGTRVMRMPKGKRLTDECLVSAYQNCGLHLHPAFWELPGYTYLEAAKLGVPTVASSWGSLPDYCEMDGNPKEMDGRIKYTLPYDLNSIEGACKEMFGKTFDASYTHPIFTRTKKDVATEIAGICKFAMP